MIFKRKKKIEIIDLTEWHKLDIATVEKMQDLTINDFMTIAKKHNWSVEILIRENGQEE